MGLSPAETETVAWLVEQHLLMSMTAQTRDLNDRKTIDDFAAVVQSVERLKMLLVLTVCDIRGVGPGVWNGWKGQLLRTLYYETELLLTGGFSEVSRAERAAAAARAAGRGAVRLAARPSARAMSACTTTTICWPSTSRTRCATPHFIREADAAGRRLATMVKTAPVRGGHRDHRAAPRTIRACCRSLPAPAPRPAATSSTRRSSRPPTAARSTRS